MASIRRRAERWQARVQRSGFPTETKSFSNKADAEKWARSIENSMDTGTFVDSSEAESNTLREVVERYINEVLPTMRGHREDTIRLKALCRCRLMQTSMVNLSPQSVATFRDERLKVVSAGTVIRELAYLSAIINHARREWRINVNNPVALVRKPAAPPGRDRLLTVDEEMRLLAEAVPTGRRSVWLHPAILLSLETGMRRGELLSARWSDVDLTRQTAHLPMTKNGSARMVPLSRKAVAVLAALPRSDDGRVIPLQGFTLHAAFNKACQRARVADLRWHDLRHTAITRMAQKLPNLIELSAVSGHKSLAMLKRYYHPSATDLAIKLG